MSATPESPQTVLCVKVDTLGDLVLFAPTLQALRDAWPSTRLVAIIRRAYGDLAPVLAPGVEWLTTTLDPFARGPKDDSTELQRIRDRVAEIRPDVVMAATSRHNWLETVIAATSGASRRLALGDTAEDEFFATQVRVHLGIDASSAFTEHVAFAAEEPDWQRNFHLADTLLGHSVTRRAPFLRLDTAAQSAAEAILRERQLKPGSYVVCAAAGFANVGLKTWPAERFGAVLAGTAKKYGLRPLLVGHQSEQAHLQSVAAAAGSDTIVWLGRDGSLPELAGLVANAGLFLGNDTGAMHLAAALDVPIVAVFGGGTWPRFVPASRRSVTVVQPLPCFGCGWDCAFGDAPCIGGITVDDVAAAVDFAWANRARDFVEIRAVEHLPESTRTVMGKAAAKYREASSGHLARQHKLEELTALDREKDLAIAEKEREIDFLKTVCDEREKTVVRVDRGLRDLHAHLATVEADRAVLEKTLRELPKEQADAARALTNQAVHIRNIESLLQAREHELTELKATIVNRAAGRHDLEQAKHYGQLLAQKEAVIRALQYGLAERDAVIQQLTAEVTAPTAKLRKLWIAARAFVAERIWRPFDTSLFKRVVLDYWMQIGVLRHYSPRPLKWDENLPTPRLPDAALPAIGLVTPSYGQERFIERTLLSVLNQHYPKLRYVVQDGGSKDRSPEIIARYAARLHHWESVKDGGQADAISRGFAHMIDALGPNDLMAWLNSDDLLGPGVLRFVAEYFAQHPNVDVIYGHRIIIDDDDRDVGRWIMPRHHPATLEWIDYVPQETLFWRKRAWDVAGGIDPSFQFALDWDLLARFHQAGCRVVRVPFFLGAFRVHAEQKTSQAIHTTGADEMRRIRTRFHGSRQDDAQMIERHARRTRFRGALTARLHEVGIRW